MTKVVRRHVYREDQYWWSFAMCQVWFYVRFFLSSCCYRMIGKVPGRDVFLQVSPQHKVVVG